ncbi:protein kinase superfamily protein [Actinidia rufa]|uniref:Protein kinase superfamily protein n=1 Tax=Actinidia rufa TaxID=165716 RepID=A0A7J0H7Y1_9ERIC|nr:protein kinase superfamily protein [Actinidia rufa]
MVYRLNVGGGLISPKEDTGMYRKWIEDSGYYNVIGALPVNLSLKPRFTRIPNYTAPDSIAEPQADVIVWSGGNGVPVYRDYAVIVPQGTEKKQNLSVALHPASKTRTLYSDAILNGIESPTDLTKTSVSSLPSDVCCHFSLRKIKATTNNFNRACIISRGRFGDVYKGYTNGGSNQVAIKRLKLGSQQGAHEFMTEIEMLSHLRYLYLVSLIGYYNEDHEMILVYSHVSWDPP